MKSGQHYFWVSVGLHVVYPLQIQHSKLKNNVAKNKEKKMNKVAHTMWNESDRYIEKKILARPKKITQKCTKDMVNWNVLMCY